MAGSAEGAGLLVGFAPGVTLTRWRRAWGERLPRVPLAVVEVPEADQRRALDSGEVDLCLVRLPLATDGLHVIRLYDEVAVAWVAKDHPLALFDEVTLADLDGEDILRDPDAASVARRGRGGRAAGADVRGALPQPPRPRVPSRDGRPAHRRRARLAGGP